eukprot:1898378-Pyramimonas_sp.AAC.1
MIHQNSPPISGFPLLSSSSPPTPLKSVIFLTTLLARIRKGLQPERKVTQAVREMLEDEMGDEVARSTQLMGKVRGVDRQQNGRA